MLMVPVTLDHEVDNPLLQSSLTRYVKWCIQMLVLTNKPTLLVLTGMFDFLDFLSMQKLLLYSPSEYEIDFPISNDEKTHTTILLLVAQARLCCIYVLRC